MTQLPCHTSRQQAFYRTADSVVIRRRLNVSLGVASVMSAPHDGGNNQSCEPARCLNRSSGRHLRVFWGARPAERHYILNGNSLVRFPLQLYRHESRKREFPHCSEGLTNGCKRLAVTLWQARVGSCSSNTSRDEDTIWQANKTTTWAHCNRMKWYWGSDCRNTHSLKSLKV